MSPFFSPNIGGVESHLDDLVNQLVLKKYRVYVHTYSPLTTAISWQPHEHRNRLFIYRYAWFGQNLFHTLETHPILDFLYLTPYLLIRTFFWLLFNHQKIDIIHSQGLNAAFAGHILTKTFHLKHVFSTHAIYTSAGNTFLQAIIKSVLNSSATILALSQSSQQQLINWGINPALVFRYRYWVNTRVFRPTKLHSAKGKLTIMFVGRLLKIKGVRLFLKIAKSLPQHNFLIIGTGPEENYISRQKIANLKFLGKINNRLLPRYYCQADILCQPALYPEGFSRVIMEATACGLPVVASNLGSIPEIVNQSTAILVTPTLTNFKKAILSLSADRQRLLRLKHNTQTYVRKNFSPKNVNLITKHY